MFRHPPRRACMLMACAFGVAAAGAAHAKADPKDPVVVPYFASLKRSVANVRVGPGLDYPIRWVYRKRGVPVEVIAVFGNWRRVRSSDGADGWVNNVLLSRTRTALVSPWNDDVVKMRARRSGSSAVVARLQARVLVRLRACDRTWCAVSIPGRERSGYVKQVKLWGVYPDEVIKDRTMWGVVEKLL